MSLIDHQDNAGGQSWDTLLNLRKKIYWNAAANSTVHMHLEHPGVAVVWTPGLVHADPVKGGHS